MRIYLKIKLKSLAAEARIIRREERKQPGDSDARTGLHHHRVIDVRRETRAACLAYGFLRRRPYRLMEAKCHERPDWKRVQQLAEKYGSDPLLRQRLADWKDAT